MGSSYRRLFKKIDNSSLYWGITIPRELEQDFKSGKNIPPRTSREIDIIWGNWSYLAKLRHGVSGGQDYYQIRYDSNPKLLKRLRKTFIQSYVILKSQKELFYKNKDKKQFRTNLTGGQQEVLIVQPIDYKTISFKVFIKIENATFVIYYLVHTRDKLIYIGKADKLGKRVKPGRQHQKMPADWDLFKYDIVKPEYSNLLERIEDHTIRSFASFFKNDQGYPSIDASSYCLVNTNWKKL